MSRLYSADMADSPRYAIYYAPAPGSGLDRFGATLLGYDAFTGDMRHFVLSRPSTIRMRLRL